MVDVEYEDVIAEIAAVQQWTLRLWPRPNEVALEVALDTAEVRRAR